jgi:hypothetical protein
MILFPRTLLAFIGIVLSVSLLAGCAGNAPVKVNGVDGTAPMSVGYRIPKERGQGFYALLEPVADGWKVVRFGTETPQRTDESQEVLFVTRDGRWVQPAYDYSEKHPYFGCMALSKRAQSSDRNVSAYGPCGGSRFASVNLAATAGRTALAIPLTWGLAVGTNREVDVTAVNAALKATGLLEQVERANTAQQRVDAAIADLARTATELGRRARSSISYDERIIDESGFFNRTGEHLGNLVRVQQPDPVAVQKAELARIPTSYADVNQFLSTYQNLAQRIDTSAATLDESYALNLQCDTAQLGPFSLKLDCPSQVRWADISRAQKVPLTVKVLTVAPRGLSPAFTHSDDTLQVLVGGREFQLLNKSPSYLEIREVSCYADGEISTRRWGSGSDQLTLPPNSQLKPPMQQSDVCRDSAGRKLQLPPVRIGDVKGRSLRFGIAVKFRRAGESVDRTIFQERALPLEVLVRGSI